MKPKTITKIPLNPLSPPYQGEMSIFRSVLLTITIAIIVTTLPLTASAATFITQEIIQPTAVITDDLYAAGEQITIKHAVDGDAFTAGTNVVIDAAINGDVFSVGENISIAGNIADDILVAGDTVAITVPTVGDIFAAASSLTISPETNISGDAYLAGGSVVLAGNFAGSVRVAANSITVAANTTIAGDLISYGANQPTIKENVTIGGETRHIAEETATNTAKSDLLGWVRQVLAVFFGAAVLLYLFPASSKRVVRTFITKPTTALGLGMTLLVLFMPAALLLLMSLVGIPAALLLLSITTAIIIAAWLYTALIIGERVMTWATKKPITVLSWQHALLGAVIINILNLIPLVGWLISTLVMITTVGAIGLVRWQELRSE